MKLEASKEYATNDEMGRKEEHEHSPNDISYHLADEQYRKSYEPFLRREILYHLDYHKAVVPIHPVQSINVQLILVTIRIVKTIRKEKLTTPHLLKQISLRYLMLSSVTLLRKTTVLRMTDKIFHILVSRLVNWFSYVYNFS